VAKVYFASKVEYKHARVAPPDMISNVVSLGSVDHAPMVNQKPCLGTAAAAGEGHVATVGNRGT
jgi:hypothetical protein